MPEHHDVLGIIRHLDEELVKRHIRTQPIECLSYKPSTTDANSYLVPPGAVAVFIAPVDSSIFAELRDAVQDPGSPKDRVMIEKLRATLSAGESVGVVEAARRVSLHPTVAAVRCGQEILARHLSLFAPSPLLITYLPFAGGTSAAMELVEYYLDNKSPHLRALAIAHQGKLTAAEAAALEKLSHVGGINIGPSPLCYAICGLTMAMTAAGITLAMAMSTPIDEDHLRLDHHTAADPETTVEKLLDLRRRALLKLSKIVHDA